jgi:hypothetical protein
LRETRRRANICGGGWLRSLGAGGEDAGREVAWRRITAMQLIKEIV